MNPLEGLIGHVQVGHTNNFGDYSFVGSGLCRSVWRLGKTNTLFKIEKSTAPWQQNADEYRNYLNIINNVDLPPIWGIPEMELIDTSSDDPIIKTEFISGTRLDRTSMDFSEEIDEFMDLTGLNDVFEHNIIYDGTRLWAIDLGV